MEDRAYRTVEVIIDSVHGQNRRALRYAVAIQQVDSELAEHLHVHGHERRTAADYVTEVAAAETFDHLGCKLSARPLSEVPELLGKCLNDHRYNKEAPWLRDLHIPHDISHIRDDIAGLIVIEHHEMADNEAEHMVHRER